MARFGDPKTEHQVRKAKRTNYFSLIFLIGFLGTSFFFFLQLQNKKTELEEKTQMLADSTENLKRIRVELEAAQRVLAVREESTMTVLQKVNDLVIQREYQQAEEVATTYQKKDYERKAVDLYIYSFGIGDRERSMVNDFLVGKNLVVLKDSVLQHPTSWLQSENTVLYSNPSSQRYAEKLAADLKTATGEYFRTMRSSASDAANTYGANWINVHHVNAAMMTEFSGKQKQLRKW